MPALGPCGKSRQRNTLVASLIGRSGSSAFRPSTTTCVDVAHGLVLLFGIGTKALPSWDSKTRRNNLSGGLAIRRTVGPSDQANSPHPSSREGHHSTARWSSSVLLSDLTLRGFHAAAASRASLRSVLLICAFNTAPASARGLTSHCDSGPASNPIRLVVGGVLQHRQQRFRFARHLYFPNDLLASPTMQMLVSLTETSSPAKWSMLRFSF